MSFDSGLFFGFEVSPLFQKSLNSLSSQVKSLIFQENDSCLLEYSHEGTLYLGKFLDKKSDIAKLELLSLNIYSLLKKIEPNYSYENSELWLMPIMKREKTTRE